MKLKQVLNNYLPRKYFFVWWLWAYLPLFSQSSTLQIMVLGISQDGGYPQIGCQKACCQRAHLDVSLSRFRASIAIIDSSSRQYWIIDATPDFPSQLTLLHRQVQPDYELAGVLLTHAHIGHYTGLMYLGHEAMGAKQIPVYVLPRMKQFLIDHGPWSQLVKLKNIILRPLSADSAIWLNKHIQVTPHLVPHRDEYSETAAFVIQIGGHKILYLPDIDKWEKWSVNVVEMIKQVDVAMVDGCFYDGDELPGRDIKEVPHPFIQESLSLFNGLPANQKNNVYFTHFNHTNPVLDPHSDATKKVQEAGLGVLEQGQIFFFSLESTK